MSSPYAQFQRLRLQIAPRMLRKHLEGIGAKVNYQRFERLLLVFSSTVCFEAYTSDKTDFEEYYDDDDGFTTTNQHNAWFMSNTLYLDGHRLRCLTSIAHQVEPPYGVVVCVKVYIEWHRRRAFRHVLVGCYLFYVGLDVTNYHTWMNGNFMHSVHMPMRISVWN